MCYCKLYNGRHNPILAASVTFSSWYVTVGTGVDFVILAPDTLGTS